SAFELSLETRKQVEKTLHERLRNSSGIQFETTPDLLCGIEVKSQEHKIAWSLESYFEELEKKLTETFKVKIDG
ncbi:MAG: F0F1 ATP synthase subunit delta, partial [Anaerolineaceae bacterium]|nr:F0F1 ATP synthase subunit delta [Anaerolineaceae bacterium]